MSNSGYDGPENPHAEKNTIPSPQSRVWEVELEQVGQMVGGEVVYARIVVDGETLGALRLPNNEHLRWLRERLADG